MSILSEVRRESLNSNFLPLNKELQTYEEGEEPSSYEEKRLYDDPFDEVMRYAGGYGYKEKELENFIDKYGQGNSFDEKAEYVLNEIINLKHDCMNKKTRKPITLKDYQKKAINHMLTNEGMVAAFEVGTGKTLTAVATAECVLNVADYLNTNVHVIIITNSSVMEHFRKEMINYGVDPDSGDYSFYTKELFSRRYNNDEIDCKNIFLIIDEAHNMRTDYRGIFKEFDIGTTEGKTGPGRAENSIACSSVAYKVLLLTATPIYNSTADIVNLVAMVKGEDPPSTYDPFFDIEDKELFKKEYGNVFLFQENNKRDFPARKDVIVGVIMNEEFLERYETEEKGAEAKRSAKNAEQQEKKSNAFYSKMRMAGNDIEPCLKCDVVVDIVMDAIKKREKVLIFSDFLESGIDLINRKLSNRDPNIWRKTFIIDGKTKPKDRQYFVDEFNSEKSGAIIFISKAGGEGLDLKGVRHVIAYEKGWNVASMEQFIGRAIRYKSHAHLPEDQRNVTIWHLLILKPSDYRKQECFKNLCDVLSEDCRIEYRNLENKDLPVKDKEKVSSDLYMFNKMIEKEKRNKRLLDALKEVQIQ